MAMRALETDRLRMVRKAPTIRQVDIFREEDIDDFMRTFDTTVTQGDLEWDKWARKHLVDQRMVRDAELMLLSFLSLSPFLTNPYNREQKNQCTEMVENHLHNVKSTYVTMLFCLHR